MLRLRLGVILILLSWFPFAQIGLYVAHNNGQLTGDSASQKFRLVIWAIQVLIGFIGLWLAGKIAIQTAKQDGWRKTSRNLWQLFWHGPQHDDHETV